MVTLEKIGLDSIQAGSHVFVGSIITTGIEPLLGVVRMARQVAESDVGTGAEDLGNLFFLIEDQLCRIKEKLLLLDGCRITWPETTANGWCNHDTRKNDPGTAYK